MWSCLKEDLVTELTESLANYLFPGIIDITSDSISDVTSQLNGPNPIPSHPESSDTSTTDAQLDNEPEVVVETIDEPPDATNIETSGNFL